MKITKYCYPIDVMLQSLVTIIVSEKNVVTDAKPFISKLTF